MIYGALTLTAPLSLTSHHKTQTCGVLTGLDFLQPGALPIWVEESFTPMLMMLQNRSSETCRYTEGDAGTVWKEQKHSAKS